MILKRYNINKNTWNKLQDGNLYDYKLIKAFKKLVEQFRIKNVKNFRRNKISAKFLG
jgi:hypothetical protein